MEIKSIPEMPVSIRYIREMELIAELEEWEICTSKTMFTQESKKLKSDWNTKKTFISELLNPHLIISLSRWAQKEMSQYHGRPRLDTIQFIPIRYNNRFQRIVYESTVDSLPSHSPIVKRWLKVYVIFDKITDAISEAIITIRGDLFE